MSKNFTGVGEFEINGKDINIEGITSFEGGEFNHVTIDGVVTVANELIANELEIDGVFNAKGNVAANHLEIDGVANLKGNLRCHKAMVDGVINLKGGSLEADSLTCDGVISSDMEINADCIMADGVITAKEIYGDKIVICSKPNNIRGFFSSIGSLFKGININSNIEQFHKIQASRVDILEATKVELQYVEVKQLCGTDVVIGEGCYVENVDCNGTLRVSRYAVVKNVTGSHTYTETD